MRRVPPPFSRLGKYITDEVRRTRILNLGGKLSELEVDDLVVEIIENKGVVRQLDVSGNNLGPKAAESFSRLFREKVGLKMASFSGNNFGNSGAAAVVAPLAEDRSLKHLSLSRNKIDSTGGELVAQMLQRNKGLTDIYLGGNDLWRNRFFFFNGFVSAISEAIEVNTSLRKLDFRKSDPSTFQRRSLERALKKNGVLEDVIFYIAPTNNASWHSLPAKDDVITNEDAQKVDDVIRDYSVILLSRAIRKISADDPSFRFTDEILQSLERTSIEKTREILFEGLNNREIKDFSAIWHSPHRQVTSQKLRDHDGAAWPPLFGQREIPIPETVIGREGWKLVARLNDADLKREGKALNHCVGGYTSKCVNCTSHIISVVDEKGNPNSTIEFEVVGEKLVKVLQHFGNKNSAPSDQSKRASAWIQEQVVKENIAIDHKSIEVARAEAQDTRITSEKLIQRKLGFNPLKDEKFKEVVDGYRDKMLPSGSLEIPSLTRNFREALLGDIEMVVGVGRGDSESDIHINIESITEKKLDPQQEKSRKGIQGSAKKICDTSIVAKITEEGVFLSTQDPAKSENLAKLQTLFAGKCEEKDGGLLIRTGEDGMDLGSVRKTLTQKAGEKRKEIRAANKKESEMEDLKTAVEVRSVSQVTEGNRENVRDY